jgi:sporulation integral membrane protein YtvI
MTASNQGYLRAVMGWAILLAGAFLFWRLVVPYLVPFVLALLLALMGQPLVHLFHGPRFGRGPAALAALALMAGVALAAAAELVLATTRELVGLSVHLPRLLDAARDGLDPLVRRLLALRGPGAAPPESLVNAQLETAYRLMGAILHAGLAVAVGLPDALLVGVVAVMAAFFLLRDGADVQRVLEWLVPPTLRAGLPAARREVVGATLGFIRAQCLLVSTTGTLVAVGLALMGSRYALLLGLAAALLDLVPYLGATALLGPWALVLFIMGRPVPALELTAILAATACARQLLEPQAVGGATGLHPLAALVALYVGLRLFGPVGFVVGPLTAVVVKAGARAAGLPPYGTV